MNQQEEGGNKSPLFNYYSNDEASSKTTVEPPPYNPIQDSIAHNSKRANPGMIYNQEASNVVSTDISRQLAS
jgi:hypothetical protein